MTQKALLTSISVWLFIRPFLRDWFFWVGVAGDARSRGALSGLRAEGGGLAAEMTEEETFAKQDTGLGGKMEVLRTGAWFSVCFRPCPVEEGRVRPPGRLGGYMSACPLQGMATPGRRRAVLYGASRSLLWWVPQGVGHCMVYSPRWGPQRGELLQDPARPHSPPHPVISLLVSILNYRSKHRGS